MLILCGAVVTCAAPATEDGSSPCGPWAHSFQGNCVLNGKAAAAPDGGPSIATITDVDATECTDPANAGLNVVVMTEEGLNLPNVSSSISVKAVAWGGSLDIDDTTHTFIDVSAGFDLMDIPLPNDGGPSGSLLNVDLAFGRSIYSNDRRPLTPGTYSIHQGSGINGTKQEGDGYFSIGISERNPDVGGNPCGSDRGDVTDGTFEVIANEYDQATGRARLTTPFAYFCPFTGRSGAGCAHIVF